MTIGQRARFITTYAASGSNKKLNSALIVTFPSPSEFPPMTYIVLRRDPIVGSAMMQVATVVSGPIATMLISSINFRMKIKRL